MIDVFADGRRHRVGGIQLLVTADSSGSGSSEKLGKKADPSTYPSSSLPSYQSPNPFVPNLTDANPFGAGARTPCHGWVALRNGDNARTRGRNADAIRNPINKNGPSNRSSTGQIWGLGVRHALFPRRLHLALSLSRAADSPTLLRTACAAFGLIAGPPWPLPAGVS